MSPGWLARRDRERDYLRNSSFGMFVLYISVDFFLDR